MPQGLIFRKMKKILLGFIAIGLLTFVGCDKEKQKGCTEPNAINFDLAAEENDGSCRYDDETTDNNENTETTTDSNEIDTINNNTGQTNNIYIITDLKLIFTNVDDSEDVVEATAQDPDGEGVEGFMVLDSIYLDGRKRYKLTFEILNNNAITQEKDIGAVIKEESEDYQMFFSFDEGAFLNPTGNGNIDKASDPIQYEDEDANGYPIGLKTLWETSSIPLKEGTFTVQLQHQPGLKTWTSSVNDGDALFYLFFSLVITSSVEYGEGATDVDGNTYKSVIIGEQEWMAENLKTSKYNDGTAIPNLIDDTEWANDTTGAWCNYENYNQYYATYGKLYNWYAVETGKLCPTGWHVPTDAEWTVLTDYLTANGHSGAEGSALKATSGWNNYGNGTDDYGWNGLPGGNRHLKGYFDLSGDLGLWWSSSQHNTKLAWGRILTYWKDYLDRSIFDKKHGFSVRCIKD